MMKVKNILVAVLFLIGTSAFAQSNLMIRGNSPDLHLAHTVASKETWYSLGRTYNLQPKDIAAANGVSIDKPLSIGQELKIPLTPANFTQDDTKKGSDVLVPLYHTVQEKEWMYRISVNHNKVPIEALERWNNITRDEAKAGTKLIVGFLKVKQDQSALASAPVDRTATPTNPPVKADPPLASGEQRIPKETPKAEAAREVKSEPNTSTTTNPAGTVNFKGGYFKSQFGSSSKNTNGVSGIFKSTSGWNDGKYYALMNSVPTGTIVKVNFPSTNKTIYAKVLGQLPDMKESAGLTIRISDAAANELGAGGSKFTVDVQY